MRATTQRGLAIRDIGVAQPEASWWGVCCKRKLRDVTAERRPCVPCPPAKCRLRGPMAPCSAPLSAQEGAPPRLGLSCSAAAPPAPTPAWTTSRATAPGTSAYRRDAPCIERMWRWCKLGGGGVTGALACGAPRGAMGKMRWARKRAELWSWSQRGWRALCVFGDREILKQREPLPFSPLAGPNGPDKPARNASQHASNTHAYTS